MDKPTCSTCPFWNPFWIKGSIMFEMTRCRKNSPAIGWPKTLPEDWCGEHPDFAAWLFLERSKTASPLTADEVLKMAEACERMTRG